MDANYITKSVTVDLSFLGTGEVVEHPKGRFLGGVPDPDLGENAGVSVVREEADEEGYFKPIEGEGPYAGALQVNLWGDSAAFRELGRYFLALAELDSSADPDFHQHHEFLSADGQTHLHLIVRKPQM